jgi:hypothetical protein
MKNQIKKFLEFNGKSIHFLAVDGEYWIALKPICEALGIHWKKQHEKLQNGEDIYGELSTDRGMVAADGKLRNMTSLPEKFVYGWIFSIPFSGSMSDEAKQNLKAYKIECCELLYDHFHGAIVGRTDLLSQKVKVQLEIDACMNTLDPDVALRLERAESQKRSIARQLSILDAAVMEEQKTLFDT